MRKQPLDRQMRLAGVGRPEDGSDARAGCALVRVSERREGHAWRVFLFRTFSRHCERSERYNCRHSGMRAEHAGPESIITIGSMDSGLAASAFALRASADKSRRPGMTREWARFCLRLRRARHDMGCEIKLRNESRTKRARIADSSR